MPKRAKRAKVNDEPIILVDNPMKAKHAKPDPDTSHGLCLLFAQAVVLKVQASAEGLPTLACANEEKRRNGWQPL